MAVFAGQNVFAGSGYGTPLRNAGAPTNGTSGTYAGKNAGKGAMLIDTQNGTIYENNNTSLSPSWIQK